MLKLIVLACGKQTYTVATDKAEREIEEIKARHLECRDWYADVFVDQARHKAVSSLASTEDGKKVFDKVPIDVLALSSHIHVRKTMPTDYKTDPFFKALQEETRSFTEAVATEQGDWIVKGFIDVYKRIYTVSVDTKVISKVMELLLIPKLVIFGAEHGYDIQFPRAQNQYPDLSFISKADGTKYAVDIKSTYRKPNGNVNGMTLGTFRGYFVKRESNSISTFAYNEYKMHLVLGIVYSQMQVRASEQKIYLVEEVTSDPPHDFAQNQDLYERVDSMRKIDSVVKDFVFFVQPKYRIAHSTPGSGNTTNIGSVKLVDQLINGEGPFASLGEEVFDDYYMHYITKKESIDKNIPRPYEGLESYFEYKKRGVAQVKEEDISQAISAEQAAEQVETEPAESDEEETEA